MGTVATILRGPLGSSFCHSYDDISDMRNLREEGLILVPDYEAQSTTVGKAWWLLIVYPLLGSKE